MQTENKPQKKRRLTKQDKKFIDEYVEHGNGTKAAKKAFEIVDPNYAGVKAHETLRNPKIINAIEEALSDDVLAKVHSEGLEANKVISANITYGDADEKTNDFIEIPDHATRAKFLDMGYKVKGRYAAEKHLTVNVDLEVSDDIKDLAKKLNGV